LEIQDWAAIALDFAYVLDFGNIT